MERESFPVTLVVAKEGELVWLGHLDFARAIERALRRADLPLRFTEGFHPRVKMRLPEPLPLGVGSDAERFVVELAQPRAAADVGTALAASRLPRGLTLRRALDGSRPERKDVALELELESPAPSDLAAALAELTRVGSSPPAVGAAVELVQAVLPCDGGGRAVVRLTPPPGGRPSVGRLLELVRGHRRAASPESSELPLSRIHRRVAWQSEDEPLPSPAPFSAGSSPCTP
jgi:hypothetical protein